MNEHKTCGIRSVYHIMMRKVVVGVSNEMDSVNFWSASLAETQRRDDKQPLADFIRRSDVFSQVERERERERECVCVCVCVTCRWREWIGLARALLSVCHALAAHIDGAIDQTSTCAVDLASSSPLSAPRTASKGPGNQFINHHGSPSALFLPSSPRFVCR